MRAVAIICLLALRVYGQACYGPGCPGGGGGGSIGCTPTGTPLAGYVPTGINGSSCSWQTVGSASVDANTVKNAQGVVVSGTNTLTGTTTTTFPGAYATYQAVDFIAVNTNTGAVTININSLGAKNLTKSGSTALAAGNIVSGTAYRAIYDGTQFQLIGYTRLAADIPTIPSSQVSGLAAISTSGLASDLTWTPGTPLIMQGAEQAKPTGTGDGCVTGNSTIYYDSTDHIPMQIKGSDCSVVSMMYKPTTATTNNFLTGLDTHGLPIKARPALADLSDASSVASIGSTNTFTGRQNATGAASTAPAKTGTSLPGTCVVGDLYFKSDATAGQNIYECASTNTWTQQLNSGGGGGSGITTSTAGTSVSGNIPTYNDSTGTALNSTGLASANVKGSGGIIPKTDGNGYIDPSFIKPYTFFSPNDSPTSAVTGLSFAANQAKYFTFQTTVPFVFNTFMVHVKTADGSNLYDVALYDSPGAAGGTATMIAHTGALGSFNATGLKAINTVSSVLWTIQPGYYNFVVCSPATFAAVLSSGNGGGVQTTFITGGTAVGGTAPSAGVCPTTMTVAAFVTPRITSALPYVSFY